MDTDVIRAHRLSLHSGKYSGSLAPNLSPNDLLVFGHLRAYTSPELSRFGFGAVWVWACAKYSNRKEQLGIRAQDVKQTFSN